MKAKPRGDIASLLKSREELKAENTSAMEGSLTLLRVEKPFCKWSYKDVWSRAGLKSQVALNSPWNAHIRAEVDSHNINLNNFSRDGAGSLQEPGPEKNLLKALRDDLKACKAQRDMALSNIAKFAANTYFFQRKCEHLEKKVERLEAQKKLVRSV